MFLNMLKDSFVALLKRAKVFARERRKSSSSSSNAMILRTPTLHLPLFVLCCHHCFPDQPPLFTELGKGWLAESVGNTFIFFALFLRILHLCNCCNFMVPVVVQSADDDWG
jgi:hypothetical protein